MKIRIRCRSSEMNGFWRSQRGMADSCERSLKLACSLIVASVLLAAFIEVAAGDSDPYLTVDKSATPILGECNKHQVVLSANGAKVIKPVDVFLVLDVSGSMGYPPDPTSLQYAKDAANSFVNQVISANPSNRVGLVKYSDIAGLVQPLTHDAGTLHDAINDLSASGYTNIDDGFYTAKVNFGNTNPCITSMAIVLLSDGVANRDRAGDSCPTWPTSHTACTLAAVASGIDAQSKATVFTVGLLGYVHNHEPASEAVARETLQQAQNGGYYQTYFGADLTPIFNEIANKLAPAGKNAVVTDTVADAFNIVPGTVVLDPPDRGTVSVSDNAITWSFPYISNEILKLKYNVVCESDACGIKPVNSGATISYEKADCTLNTQTFPNPSAECICISCAWTSNSPVCNGKPVVFTGPPGMDSWSWSFGDGGTSDIQSPEHTYASDGSYSVSLTVKRGSCENACPGMVDVLELPDCSWTSNSPVCDGTAVNFHGPTGMDSYSWAFGDGGTSTEKDPSHTYSGPGTYIVRLIVTKDGCSKTCLGWVEVILADCIWTACTPMCNGTEMQFHAPSGMDTYLWDFGDGKTSTEEDPSHLYPAPGTYTVTLAVTKGQCSDTCEGSVEVIVCPPNPPEYNSTVSYEDLLKSQYDLITSFGNLLKNTTFKEDRQELYDFLESFDDLAHRQKKGIYSYEDLVSHRWQELTPQQKIELTDSFETLLRQAEIILSCEEDLLKRDWCKLSPDEQQHFLDKFEDDLHYQQMLLLKFEDWLHHQQTMEDCYKKWWLKFLASFNDLIQRQSNLLDSFEMLMKIDCNEAYITVEKSADKTTVNAGDLVAYTYTITAKGFPIKNVEVKDSLWGKVGTIENMSPGLSRTLTLSRALSCVDCNNCQCKVCNFATVCSEVITPNGNLTACDVSNDVCIIVDDN